MKIIHDNYRSRQSLFFSALITSLVTVLCVVFVYQNRLAALNAGMNRLVSEMNHVFNDNELIADATGVRFHQNRTSGKCGSPEPYQPRGNSEWTINGNPAKLNLSYGTLIVRVQSREAQCLYSAAEFVRFKINQLNPGTPPSQRYIIASNHSWFYWFSPENSVHFQYSNSKMANDSRAFFSSPESFYDRLLRVDTISKSSNSTGFYKDIITGEPTFSIVSYIYNLSKNGINNDIIAYLVYDHSRPELVSSLKKAFNQKLPTGLIVELVERKTGAMICLTQKCQALGSLHIELLSKKYEFRYGLPLYLFIIYDPLMWIVAFLFPLLLGGGYLIIRWQLNNVDSRLYTDQLTGCYTRKIYDVISRSNVRFNTVTVFDCNQFKSINDNWGHNVGDMALQVIARCLMNNTRAEKDIVIRSGGDEFLLLSTSTTMQVDLIAKRIGELIVSHEFVVDMQRIPLSVSWGIAPCNDKSLGAAIQSADIKMYEMKQRNKNSVVCLN